MKRTFIIIALLSTILGFWGCEDESKYEYWITYDDINCYSATSDTSAVVRKMNGWPWPLEIVRKDETGKWGYYVIERNTFKKEKRGGWLYLDDMVYCGTQASDERFETFVVRPNEVALHKHPRADKKDVLEVSLVSTDTVQVTERSDDWAHVRCPRLKSNGRRTVLYGWVQESQLQQIETKTYGELVDRVKAEARKDQEKDFSPLMVESHRYYTKVMEVIGYAAFVIAIIFLIPAIRRKKILNVLLLLPIGALLVAVGSGAERPNWFVPLVLPLMTYVVCYPLLYFNTSKKFGWIFVILSVLVAGYYLVVFGMSGGVWRIILTVILACVCIFMMIMIKVGIEDSICENCGYFAKMERGEKRHKGTTISQGIETERVYSHTKTETVGDTKYITNYYEDQVYDTETTTEHYEADYTCRRCGHTVTRQGSSSRKRRTRRR